MRAVNLNNLGAIKDPAVRQAIREVELASAEFNLVDIANAFTVNDTFTETRELNVSSPTLANAVAVIATFIADCKRGGQHRTT